MRIEVEPRRIVAGADLQLTVLITNTGSVISGYTIRLLGIDPAWVALDEAVPRLFPGESTVVTAQLQIPAELPAGERRVAVQVRAQTDDQLTAVEEVVLHVPGAPQVDVTLEPATVTAGRRAVFEAHVHNRGNTQVAATLLGVDEERALGYAVDPPQFALSPGEHATLALTVRGRRPLVGSPQPRPFELYVDADLTKEPSSGKPPARRRRTDPEPEPPPTPDGSPAAMGVLVQKPRLSRGALALGGLLLAITVFAVVITTAMDSLVSRSAADRDLALQVAQAQEAPVTSGSARLGGQVLLMSTGAPVAGVSVEVFDESDTAAPLATAATDDAGSWAVDALPAGIYKLLFRGAGFAEVWYPSAATDAEAAAVELAEGGRATNLAVLLGGVPATVSGTVQGADVAGATAVLELPLDVLEGTVVAPAAVQSGPEEEQRVPGAVVHSVPVGSDGEFTLADVPSPGIYDLVVTKPGYGEQVQRIDLAAGETRADLVIQLLDGDGSISGRVEGAQGPIGGASVAATFGETTVRTVSLTEDDPGAFTLRGLPTPGTYTVIVSSPGHASATLSLHLGPGQELTGVAATLGADAGTLGGTVSAPGGGGDVTVTVSDGSITRQTVTQSTDPVGSWSVSGLRIPSTYTVTFTRGDLDSQIVSVSLDGYGAVTSGAPAADQVDAAMRSATATLRGTVRQYQPDGGSAPVGNVTVSASSGTVEYTVTTASTGGLGSYALEELPPGTYTVTFTRRGTATTSEIITLGAAERQQLSPVLVAAASISGAVTDASGPVRGAVVHLYRAGEYGTAAPPHATTTADDAGHYRFTDVDAPGNYLIDVRRSASGVPLATSAPITLDASEQRSDVDLRISEGP